MAKKSGLGKGLSAIFMENESEDQNNTVTLNISEITFFDKNRLWALATLIPPVILSLIFLPLKVHTGLPICSLTSSSDDGDLSVLYICPLDTTPSSM